MYDSHQRAPQAKQFALSLHAQGRIVERARFSPGEMLIRLNAGAFVWIKCRRLEVDRFALIACPNDEFVVAVITQANKVKTFLTFQQWNERHAPIPPTSLARARFALLRCGPIAQQAARAVESKRQIDAVAEVLPPRAPVRVDERIGLHLIGRRSDTPKGTAPLHAFLDIRNGYVLGSRMPNSHVLRRLSQRRQFQDWVEGELARYQQRNEGTLEFLQIAIAPRDLVLSSVLKGCVSVAYLIEAPRLVAGEPEEEYGEEDGRWGERCT